MLKAPRAFSTNFPGGNVSQLASTPIASDFKSKLLLLPHHCARGERKKMSADKLMALGRTLPTRDQMQGATANNCCQTRRNERGSIWYLEILDGKDSGSERNVPFAELVLGMGFLERQVIGRDSTEPLFPTYPPRGGQASLRGIYRPLRVLQKIDEDLSTPRGFSFIRGRLETDLKNLPGVNQAWIEEGD